MIDLRDVTFTIPVRIDTPERVRNIRTVVQYICKHFDTNVLVAEESIEAVIPGYFADLSLKFGYAHIQTNNPLMHRTKLLNIMAKSATTPIIVNYDTDVVLKLEQYVAAVQAIRSNQLDMVYPYNGKFIDIHGEALHKAVNDLDVSSLTEKSGNLIHPNSLGGAVFWNRTKFIECGLENENFISWGFEDNERVTRATKLGYRIGRIDGCIFHMYHPPSLNSANADHPAYKNNQKEFEKVYHMSPQQLRAYVNTWPWIK